MGDRSNVYIIQGEEDGLTYGVGVYSHWGGEAFQKAALSLVEKAAERAGDTSYFTRILIHNLLDAEADPDSPTGVGVWTTESGMDDNSHPILVIDARTGLHWYATERGYRKMPT